MDKAGGKANRTNQCNPNHKETGGGHAAGYQGKGTPADLANHANQLNQNNPLYQGEKDSGKPSGDRWNANVSKSPRTVTVVYVLNLL